jgi:hypothetical protein
MEPKDRRLKILETLMSQLVVFTLAQRAILLAQPPEDMAVSEAMDALLKDDPDLSGVTRDAVEEELSKLLRARQ